MSLAMFITLLDALDAAAEDVQHPAHRLVALDALAQRRRGRPGGRVLHLDGRTGSPARVRRGQELPEALAQRLAASPAGAPPKRSRSTSPSTTTSSAPRTRRRQQSRARPPRGQPRRRSAGASAGGAAGSGAAAPGAAGAPVRRWRGGPGSARAPGCSARVAAAPASSASTRTQARPQGQPPDRDRDGDRRGDRRPASSERCSRASPRRRSSSGTPTRCASAAQRSRCAAGNAAGGVRIAGEQQQGVQQLDELVVERDRVAAGCRSRARRPGQRRGHVPGLEGVPQRQHHLERGQAEDVGDRVLVDVAAGERADAVEQRQRVAQAALGGAGEQLRGGRARREAVRWPRSSSRRAPRSGPSGIGRKSTCRQRERIVAGNLCLSVEARMKTTCAGGSSRILSSASKASLVSWCASSRMKTR